MIFSRKTRKITKNVQFYSIWHSNCWSQIILCGFIFTKIYSSLIFISNLSIFCLKVEKNLIQYDFWLLKKKSFWRNSLKIFHNGWYKKSYLEKSGIYFSMYLKKSRYKVFNQTFNYNSANECFYDLGDQNTLNSTLWIP